jgi:NAD(P)-dependent dehydrogenase (short-subunit alcohol dehydrogenase family)
MRALLYGTDDHLEAALRGRGLELAAEGEADALITVGPAPMLRPLDAVTPEEWTKRFRSWVAEPFWAVQAWLRDVLRRGAHGRWVAITTTLGTKPFPGGGPDGAAVVALHTLVRIAAIEYGARGIRANAIAPGWREQLVPPELDLELALADTPAGRLVTGTDLAGAVIWLLSDDADQVNGEILRVDGGYTITRGSRPDPRRYASVPDPRSGRPWPDPRKE